MKSEACGLDNLLSVRELEARSPYAAFGVGRSGTGSMRRSLC